jgi:hypothetical protein
MLRLSVLLASFFFLSCGTSSKYPSYMATSKSARAFIAAGEPERAIDYLDSFPKDTSWCLSPSRFGGCSNRQNRTGIENFKSIYRSANNAIACRDAQNRCETTKYAQDFDVCIGEMEQYCTKCSTYSCAPWEAKSWASISKFKEARRSAPEKAINESQNAKDAAVAVNKCKNGLRWGYYELVPTNITGPGVIGGKKLVGEFINREDCEAERLKMPTSKKSIYSDKCVKRYAGETQIIKVVRSHEMKKYDYSYVKKRALFTSKTACEEFKKKSESRFIDECKEIEFKVCEAGKRNLTSPEFKL